MSHNLVAEGILGQRMANQRSVERTFATRRAASEVSVRAERLDQRESPGKTFAALSATSEAIKRVRTHAEFVQMVERLAGNAGLAFENFDRADDRRLAEEQKERLIRMFAALSETNEAMMRAQTRAELFHLV